MRSFRIKPHREVSSTPSVGTDRAENELILNCLSGEATGLLGGWDRRFESPAPATRHCEPQVPMELPSTPRLIEAPHLRRLSPRLPT